MPGISSSREWMDAFPRSARWWMMPKRCASFRTRWTSCSSGVRWSRQIGSAASGSQIIAFTTGRGNPIGNAVVPVVKITGNHDTYLMMEDFLDFDTSASISGEKTMEELAEEMLDLFLRVCSGEKTKAELNGCIENMISQTCVYG